MLPPPELRARVLLAARREPAALRASVRRRQALVLLAACGISGFLFLSCGGVREAPRPLPLVLATALGATLIAVALAALGVAGRRSMLGRSGAWLKGWVVATPLALLAWKVAVSAQFEHMMLRWPERVGLRCLWLSCLLAVAPLLALLLLRTRSDPVQPALTGAALGAAVGSASWVLVDLTCPVAYVPHLLLGHVLPLLLITLVGAALGARMLALRSHSNGF